MGFWLGPQKMNLKCRKILTFRLLMSYIYIEHPFLMFLDHTRRRSTVGRTPLNEWSARSRDLYLTTHDTHNRQISMPPVGFEPTISAGERPQAARLGEWVGTLLVRAMNWDLWGRKGRNCPQFVCCFHGSTARGLGLLIVEVLRSHSGHCSR